MRWWTRAATHRDLLLVGVNSRDLATLKVVPGRLDALARLAADRTCKRVAESGVATADDAARMAACGYDLALVGSALMSAADPAQLARAMLAQGARRRVARARERRPRMMSRAGRSSRSAA